MVFSLPVYGCLVLGWAARKIRPSLQSISRGLSRWTVIFVETPTILLIFWGIRWDDFLTYYRISIIAILVYSISGIFGFLIARLYGKNRLFQGSFTVSSMFSNVGPTMGGFLCLLYFGKRGLLLSQMYTLLAVPYFFTVVFTVARMFSTRRKVGFVNAIKENFKDPVSLFPVFAIIVGITLGLSGTPFSDYLELPRRVFVFTAVIIYSLSFGLSMKVRLFFKELRHYLGILPVKFIIAPATGALLAVAAGYTLSADPLAFKVIVVQSAMPVAIWAVVATKIFELDDNLSVGLWIFTTAATAALLPFISWLSRLS